MASKILISIRPEYVRAILDGTKKYEYRRIVPASASRVSGSSSISGMVIYETAPVKAVVGEADICGIISLPVEELWEITQEHAGISKAAYLEYFKGCSMAHALQIGSARAYERPVTLAELGITHAPQSWRYL